MEPSRVIVCAVFKITVSVLIIFAPIASTAQAKMDLVQIYKKAMENDPQFARSEYVHLATLEKERQALGMFLPSLAFNGEYKKTNQDILSSDNEVFGSGKSEYDSKQYTLSLTQPVFNYATWAGYDQSKQEIAQSLMMVEVASQDLLMRCANAYFTALAAEDNLEFAKSGEAAIRLNNKSVEKRYRAGLATVVDLYDSRARLSTSTAQVADAENILKDALRGIEEITGEYSAELVPSNQDSTLFYPHPLDVEQWVEQALKNNPSILMKRHSVKSAKSEVKKQRAGHFPIFDLVGRFNHRDTDGSLFGGGSEVQTAEFLLTASLPLYQGGGVSSRVRETGQLVKAEQQSLLEVERSVERLVRKAYQGVLGSISRVEALEKGLEAQELTLKAKRKGFAAGLLTALSVLDAERDLYFIRLDYATARYEYLLNSLRLKQGAGILTEIDLVAMNEEYIRSQGVE